MKSGIAPKLLGFSDKVTLLLLVCSLPLVSVLMILLNYSNLRVIYALQSISPICALVIMLLGVKNKEIQYLQQLNLIFILPYSFLGISFLKKFFDLQNLFLSLFIVWIYLANSICLNLLASVKEKHQYEKHKYAFWRICFSLYLLPLVFYNIDFSSENLSYEKYIFTLILVLSVLFYSVELLRSYFKYKEKNIEKKADFLLLSQIVGYLLLGIGLDFEVGNWFLALPLLAFSNMSYTFYSLECFQTENAPKFVALISTILVFFTLFLNFSMEKDVKKAYLILVFLVLICELYLGIIVHCSFLARFYEKVRFLTYFGFLCGIFYIIGVLPSDFLPEFFFISGNVNAILFSLSTIIQSLASVLAILTTFITFVFIYVLTGKRNSFTLKEDAGESTSEIADLVLLVFLLNITLALGYRLVKVILSALTAMGVAQSNISALDFISNIIRDSQASFCIVLIYLLIVGCVLIIYHIRYRLEWSKIEELFPGLEKLLNLFQVSKD